MSTPKPKDDQAKRLKKLEAEIARLKRVVADLTVDNLILAEAAEENGREGARRYPLGR